MGFLNKKIIIPTLVAGFLFVAVSFQNDFFALRELSISPMWGRFSRSPTAGINERSSSDTAIPSAVRRRRSGGNELVGAGNG